MARGLAAVERVEIPRPEPDVPLADLRFRKLLGEAGWAALPAATRHRFSKRLVDGATIVYLGEILEAWMSPAGWLLAQAARLIGGPLPTGTNTDVPTVVTVTEDPGSGGQNWTRLYARHRGFPQVIHSCKRFSGPTGLEEYLGYGFSIALRVSAEAGALVFRSEAYLVALGRVHIRLPRWAAPGALTITHRETAGGSFVFSLELVHRFAGTLIRQSASYQEAKP